MQMLAIMIKHSEHIANMTFRREYQTTASVFAHIVDARNKCSQLINLSINLNPCLPWKKIRAQEHASWHGKPKKKKNPWRTRAPFIRLLHAS